MVFDLSCEESRITIFDQKLICVCCGQDVFIPYRTYRNVENQEKYMLYGNYTAICTHCGYAIQFEDPSRFNEEGVHVWAFEQTLLHVPEPPAPPVVDEAKLQAQKKCLHLGLQLLVQKKNIDQVVFFLAEDEQYNKLSELLEPENGQGNEEMNPEKCLATVLYRLTKYRIINREELHAIIINKSYPGIELFLEKHLK